MQPATSAFGVIAVLYVMITATAENSSGAIEPGINHPRSEERRASGNETARARSNLRGSLVSEDDPLDGVLDPRGIVAGRGSNGSTWNLGVSTITASRAKEVEEEDEEEETDEEDKKDTSSGIGRTSNTSIDVVDGLQGDQSDVRAIPGTQDDPSGDPRGLGTGHVLGSAGVETPSPPDDHLRLVLQEEGTTPKDLAVATTLLSRLLLASERGGAAGEDLVADQASGTRSDGEVFNNEARRQQARPLGENDRDDPRGTDTPRMENLVEDRGQEFTTTDGSFATGFVTTGTVRTTTLARGSGGSTTSPWTTTASSALRESIAIDAESRSLGRKDLEDLRAISFQVPPVEGNEEGEETEIRGHQQQQWWQTKSREYEERKVSQQQHHHQQQEPREQMEKSISVKIDEARKLAETRKDHSRPVNNLLLAGSGKSTKAFYEIKPSIKTEMEKSHDPRFASGTTTQRILTGRKFILPSVDSAFGKFGPYFEDGDQEMNITARIGSTVLLNCKIGMLGDKKVTWLQHSKDSFRLLTVGRTPYSVDQRISLNFRYPSNWRLQILYASPRDSGLYKCQVATHPPLVKKINVIVTAPILTITDDSGRIVAKERHLKAGSALRLRCEARDVLESQNESVVWTRGDETLTEDVSENRTTEISAGKEVLVIVSTLIVERASPRHAGNYSCVVPGKAKTTLAVHVLNGELPAAVHDGNGVSRAVLNLWLIHLTVSYVFSR